MDNLTAAVERGRAYLDAGAPVALVPMSQNVALTALQELTEGVVERGEGVPSNMRMLN